MALRTCPDCGLEARSKEELEAFSINPRSNYGRANLCKECKNKRLRQYRQTGRYRKRSRAYEARKKQTDDHYYLRKRFLGIKNRCYNPNEPKYPIFGVRGITVCQEWLDNPDTFIDWALANGWKKDLQIHRIDNEDPYHPDNCLWISSQEHALWHKRGVIPASLKE